MQVFLPYPEFDKSAQVLDNQRLNKQKVETLQIFNTIIGNSEGWKNHPAVRSWKGFPESLWNYGYAIEHECLSRNIDVHVFFTKTKYTLHVLPPWFYDDRLLKVNLSHRSRLLFKGRVDAVAYSVRKFLKVRSINEWFLKNNYPQKNVFKHPDIERLEKFALDNNIQIIDNHYKQFGWTEDDRQPYFWPV